MTKTKHRCIHPVVLPCTARFPRCALPAASLHRKVFYQNEDIILTSNLLRHLPSPLFPLLLLLHCFPCTLMLLIALMCPPSRSLSLQRKPRSTLCIHSIISCSSWQSSFVNHSGYEDKSPAEKKLRMQSLTAIYLTNFLSAVGFSIMVRSMRAGKAPQCGAVCTGVAWLTCVCTCALCTRQSRCIYL